MGFPVIVAIFSSKGKLRDVQILKQDKGHIIYQILKRPSAFEINFFMDIDKPRYGDDYDRNTITPRHGDK